MKKVILHIGHGKTGSSHIQSMLAKNVDYMESLGIHYPYHPSLDEAAENITTSGNGLLLMDSSYQIPNDKDVCLYSSEMLFHDLVQDNRINRLAASLTEQNIQLVVVMYTRNYFDFSFSSWGQSVKRSKSSMTYDEFMRSGGCKPNYQLIKHWIQLSEELDFELKLFNYSKHKKSLFNHFFNQLSGFDYEAEQENLVINRSMTLSEYEIQRLFNVKYEEISSSFISDKFVNELPKIKSEKPLVKLDIYRQAVKEVQPVIDFINTGSIAGSEYVEIEDISSLPIDSDSGEQTFSFNEEQLSTLVSSISHRLQKNDESIACLNTEIGEKATAIANLQTEVKEKANAIANLQTEVKEKANAIANLQTEVKEKANAIANLQTEVKEKANAIANLKMEVKEKANVIGSLKEEIESTKKITSNAISTLEERLEKEQRLGEEKLDFLREELRKEKKANTQRLQDLRGELEEEISNNLSQFSAPHYLYLNPDVHESGADPYSHFLLFGIQEGREWHPSKVGNDFDEEQFKTTPEDKRKLKSLKKIFGVKS